MEASHRLALESQEYPLLFLLLFLFLVFFSLVSFRLFGFMFLMFGGFFLHFFLVDFDAKICFLSF